MMTLDRCLHVRIVTAEPEFLVSKLSAENIELSDIHFCDLLTVECKLYKRHFRKFRDILRKTGSTYTIVKREGLLWKTRSIGKRPIFLIGILVFLTGALIAPNRVYFIKITGNSRIPKKLILSEAEKSGIRFGTKASLIRSEEIKNQLLGRIPELQWVGITTSGSVATIHVLERDSENQQYVPNHDVSSIVAARDGVITQITVKKGNPLYSVGQSVKCGDVLVSGYTDCGIKIVAESADAEVFAHTLREIKVASPLRSMKRGSVKKVKTAYQLRIGKKVINLWNHSGISDATCVKMYLENYWTLPGGFQLPVSLIKVKYIIYDQLSECTINETDFQWLVQFARSYLNQQMISGTIQKEDLQWEISDDVCVLSGIYACNEMIGQVKYEENLEQNAEDN